MKDFKVDDRVRVYGLARGLGGDGTHFLGRDEITLEDVREGLSIGRDKRGIAWEFHIKQCRKLKPAKAEKKARERLINTAGIAIPFFPSAGERNPVNYQTHAIEVLPGSVQVTREELAKAWDIMHDRSYDHCSEQFKDFCKALGLEARP